jgi:hypothetical protein
LSAEKFFMFSIQSFLVSVLNFDATTTEVISCIHF